MYLWILIVGGINSFFDACGIGSNDLANSFGTTYGSRILNLKQIVMLASVCEFSGALLLGSSVTSTLAGSISHVRNFAQEPFVLMYGMLCALAASTVWIYTATYLEMPVSTTHSIVGGILGFSFVYRGENGVNWYSKTDEFPYMTGVVPVVISWFTSPLLSAFCTVVFYGLIRKWILRSGDGVRRTIYSVPGIVFCTFFIEAFFILTKAAKSKLDWTVTQSAWVSICIAAGSAVLSAAWIPFLKKRVAKFATENNLEEAMMHHPTHSERGAHDDKVDANTDENGETNTAIQVHMDANVASVASVEPALPHVEQFDPQIEYVYKYLQVFTSICASFAHGANDVSNSVGPFAAMWYIYRNQKVSSKIDVPIWILAMGGAGIVIGLATYGLKIIKVLGEKITLITPSRGFAAELATALVVSFASRYGMPISSTQCITGAIIGINFMDHAFLQMKWKMIGKMYVGWIFTLIVTALLSAAIFAQGIYSPNVIR